MEQDHTHRWRIEPPHGPTSRGHCRGCGQYKVFHNSHAFSSWNPLNKDRKSRISEEMIETAIERQGSREATWGQIAKEYEITRNYLHKLVKDFRERPNNHLPRGLPTMTVINARHRKVMYVTT